MKGVKKTEQGITAGRKKGAKVYVGKGPAGITARAWKPSGKTKASSNTKSK